LGVPELLTYAEQYGGSHVRAYVLVDGFAWEKQDPQFVSAMLGMYRKLETGRREFTEKFVRSMYKKPQPEEYIERVVAASLKMPADSAIAAKRGLHQPRQLAARGCEAGSARDGHVRNGAEEHGCRSDCVHGAVRASRAVRRCRACAVCG
jgi:hypothetical protein